MRLICPNCDAQYEVDAAMIPASGRDVQCSNCGKTWFQGPDSAGSEPVSAKESASGDGLTDEAREFFSREDTTEPDAELVSEAGPDADEPSPDDSQQDPWKPDLDEDAEEASEVAAQAEQPHDDRSEELAEEPEEPQRDEDTEPHDETPEPAEAEPAQEPVAEEPETAEQEPHDAAAEEDHRERAERDDHEPDQDTDAEVHEEPPEETEDDSDEDHEEEEERPEPKRPDIDAAVLGILKAEAEREMAARRAEEAEAMESQPDLGLSEPGPVEKGEGAISARTARLRGGGTDEDQNGARKTLLPDIDEINSTLTATSDRVSAENAAADAVQQVRKRRSGFRIGFAVLMLATAIAILLYLYAPQLGRLVPALEPALASYVDWANGIRLSIDGFLERSVESLTNLLISISS